MSTSANGGAGRPTVFVSYSRKDTAWKDLLVQQLKVLESEGVLEVWDDQEISLGGNWKPEIEQAMERAAAAVLLISAASLNSEFILGEEIPRLLERRRAEGFLVVPVLVRPCDWKGVPWLASISWRPRDGRPLSRVSKAKAEECLADLVGEIRQRLSGTKSLPASTGLPRLDLGRLPPPGLHFVGRDAELARLDAAWENPKAHVLTFVAFGGVGKSTLVANWLGRMAEADWRGARRVLDWSFYSQGTEERVTSADRFLDHALQFFGDIKPMAGAARDRGQRLADLIRKEKTLLILDGLEPLQHPAGPLAGKLKDPGLAALLKSLAAGNPGLCVVTTPKRPAGTWPRRRSWWMRPATNAASGRCGGWKRGSG